MQLGKRASRKSLIPDWPNPKAAFAKSVAELTESRASAETVEHDMADDVLELEKVLAPGDLQEFLVPENLALAKIGDNDGPPEGGSSHTAQQEDFETIGVDTPASTFGKDYNSSIRNRLVEEPEEHMLPGAEKSISDINEDTTAVESLPSEELAASLSERPADLDSSGLATPERIVPSFPHSACEAKIGEQDGEIIKISVLPLENAENCSMAVVPEVVLNNFQEHEKSGIFNLTTVEKADIESITPESENNLIVSNLIEGGKSATAKPENIQEKDSSSSDQTTLEIRKQSPVPTGDKESNPVGVFWSPKFSLAAQGPAATIKEDATDREAQSITDNNTTPFKSARIGDGDKILQDSPAIRKLRHSIRLSMEDLTPEEITEAAVVFHNYTGRKESEPTIESPPEGSTDNTRQTPPKADLIVTVGGGETSEEPVEAPKGRTRSGARLSDDTTMLKEFLSRAQARKLAQPSSIPTSAPKLLASPHRTPRKALAELDSNSPSTQKQRDITNRPGTPPGKGKLAAIDFEDLEEAVQEPTSCRRSTRTRSPAPSKSAPGAPSFIPVRRADGADSVILQKSAAQELAIVTRANTRRNKGQAKIPSLTLQSLPVEGSDLTAVQQGNKDAKSVGWDEKLVYFQEVTDSTEVKEEKRPRVRRLRGLGGVNGTPAPKKMMADVTISYGTPAPKRRGKVR